MPTVRSTRRFGWAVTFVMTALERLPFGMELWNLYDAVAAAKKANNAKALKSATAKYNKAVAAAKKAMNAKK